jgi:sugar lactone lactonase YvrE
MPPQSPLIFDVIPRMGVPGGEVSILCRDFTPNLPSHSKVVFGETPADIVSASDELVIARVPCDPHGAGVRLTVGEDSSPTFPFSFARSLASGLHPVTNPVVAPDGSIITTISGSRGQQVSEPLVRVTREGGKIPFACDLMNPTGLAFGPDGQLYVSSRHEGVVYRYTDFERLDVVADELGIACGIAFDSRGNLFVGDRSGRIYRIDGSGSSEEFARLEPSVSAYHLAVDSEDAVYVTGPTFSMKDKLFRISSGGSVEALLDGLARPQGLTVMPGGDLLIASSYQGKKGLFRFSPASAEIEHCVAAPTLVGVALSGNDLFLADSDSLAWIRFGAATEKPV